MIVYAKTNGKAHDLRFEADGYILKANEASHDGDELPDIETLHDPTTITEIEVAAANDQTKARLHEIDLKSIRSLREWLAAREDAPEFIKNYEAEAIAERARLTGQM